MNKRLILTAFLGFIILSVSAQDFSTRDIRLLQRLQLDTSDYDLSDAKVRWNMEAMLNAHKRARLNSGFAIGFTTLGALYFMGGALLLSSSSSAGLASEFVRAVGMLNIAMGVSIGAASIPFWFATKKHNQLKSEAGAKLAAYP